jgi:Concanavalin A-like lectin/glucanases superfamily
MTDSYPARILAISAVAFLMVVIVLAGAASAGLTHRYSFNDAGTAKDSVGNVDGVLNGGATVAGGRVAISNTERNSGDDKMAYVDFPRPLLPKSGSATLVAWFTCKDVGQFARVMDIGEKDGGEGEAFIYFTPRDADELSRGAITATDAASKVYCDVDRLDDGKPHMIALVIDGNAKKLHLFVDGTEPQPAVDLGPNTLDAVRQQHTWLGRSAFEDDAGFNGSIDEFRVYDQALSAGDVAAAFKAGPNSVVPVSAATTQQSK